MCFRYYTVIHIIYSARGRTHALPEIDPADKGTAGVTHECGAISRHRYPQFNTRLRLRRVTAVNFRSRPIYCMHVIPGCAGFKFPRTAQFPRLPDAPAISAIISEPRYQALASNVSFTRFHLFCERNLSSALNVPRFISIIEWDVDALHGMQMRTANGVSE